MIETDFEDDGFESNLTDIEDGGDVLLKFGKYKGRTISQIFDIDDYYIPKILTNDHVPDKTKEIIRRCVEELELGTGVEIKKDGRFSWVEESDGDVRLLFGKFREVSCRELIRSGKRSTIVKYTELDFMPADLVEKLEELLLDEQGLSF